MPYTEIHPIKSTLQKAIDYVTKPEKTDNQKNIISRFCDFKTASHIFEYTKKSKNLKNNKIEYLAYHMIQSFAKGITVEQAQAIGTETMKRFLKEEYEYVMATHNDTENIHNHFIINSINMINGKSFSREHDRKYNPAWIKFRKISDEVSKEFGIEIIENPEKNSVSHYEWTMQNHGTSWKAQIKEKINETIRVSDDFDDFIRRLRENNVTVRYEDYKTKDGKILAFKLDGQKHFVYSQKLGKYYSESFIKSRIANAVKRRNMSPVQRRQERILNDDGSLKKLYDLSKFGSVQLVEWAKNQNRKISMQTLNEVKKCGFNSPDEFFKAYEEMKSDVNNSIFEMKEIIELLEKHKKEIQITMHYLDIYRDNKETYDYYKNKTMYPERYFRNHESEILLFTEAKQELLKRGSEIPNAAKLKNKLYECEEKIAQARERIASLSTDIKEYDVIKHNLDVIYERSSDERRNDSPEKSKNKENDIEL